MQNNIILALFVGQSIVKLKEVDSTNTYLRNLLSNSKPLLEGTVIMAEHQFAGRGQSSNVWKSDKGLNLTFSILLKPTFLPVNKQFQLNKVISLGINDYLTSIIGEPCKIKWPNDIYYENKKLGGVLIENISKGYQLKESIIGIGLNINQKDFGDGLERATSISEILHQDYELEKILAHLCWSIERRYLQLKANKWEVLDKDYSARLFRINEAHFFNINNTLINGIIKGVTKDGRLSLEINNELIELDLKEVKFIFD
ncbi:MAG: biotin--[acetyl-CoA-carboxylase] ligase [Pelobium sp.]